MATYSLEDIVNQGLRRVGYKVVVGFIYEGSEAARVALDIYGQARDELLAGQDWDFARALAPLTLLKTAPVGGYNAQVPWNAALHPPIPWVYEYAYPQGCINVRAVRPAPTLIPSYAPVARIFTLGNDPTQTEQRVVLTNQANAYAVFTAQVTDPNQWSSPFIEALVDSLGRRLAQGLGAQPEEVKMQAQFEQATDLMTASTRG